MLIHYTYISKTEIGFTFPPKTEVAQLLPDVGPRMLKAYPGFRYAPELGRGTWVGPIEGVNHLKWFGSKVGLTYELDSKCKNHLEAKDVNLSRPLPQELYLHQIDPIYHGLEDRALLIAHEMGLGKTVIALQILRCSVDNPQNILIVAPKIAQLGTWPAEITRWWPEKVDAIHTIKGGKIRKLDQDLGEKVVLTSWGIWSRKAQSGKPSPVVQKILDISWDAIILDESHYLSGKRTNREGTITTLREENQEAILLLLTGTPIADDPSNLWAQINLLYPRRYGTFWQFKTRYCDAISNPYAYSGITHKGVRKETRQELQARLSYVMSRATKLECAKHLPPIITKTISIPQVQTSVKSRLSERAYYKWLAAQEQPRIKASVGYIEDALYSGVAHVAVMTKLRATAKAIAAKIQGSLLITGETPAEKREALILTETQKETSVVVCTIGSVGISINSLVAYRDVLFAELSYYPLEVLQAIARFHRLTSAGPVSISFLAGTDGPDQKLAWALEKKIENEISILGKGSSEQTLLQGLVDTNEDWQTRLVNSLFDVDAIDEDREEDYLEK